MGYSPLHKRAIFVHNPSRGPGSKHCVFILEDVTSQANPRASTTAYSLYVIYNTVEPRTRDTLGLIVLSLVERLSLSLR